MTDLSELKKEIYLGDGLYASFDGFGITLRAPREDGDHYVYLEPEVLAAFKIYVRKLERIVDEYSTKKQEFLR